VLPGGLRVRKHLSGRLFRTWVVTCWPQPPLKPAAALALLESHADGLDPTEAAAAKESAERLVARRLVRDGPNDIQHEQPLPAWLHLWRCTSAAVPGRGQRSKCRFALRRRRKVLKP